MIDDAKDIKNDEDDEDDDDNTNGNVYFTNLSLSLRIDS